MTRIQKTIEVGVPVRIAYEQWTQFEDFPMFMDGVERVVQRDDKSLDWTATIGGQKRQWTAEIVDQTPDVRIAWKSTQGTHNAGAVVFEPIGADRAKVELTMEADPEGPIEDAGVALGFLDRRVAGDLDRFKTFIESRRAPTGAWTGEIHGSTVEHH
jgi:uncharacterized membrane protein